MSQYSTQPPAQQAPGPGLRPHRGAMILVFGILSWVMCFIFGIVAWVMGNSDLREMNAGRMDPSGRGLTQAGRVIGMVHICLMLGLVVFYLGILGIMALVAAFSAGSSAP